jgi:glycosyltransferase involved in cell wall biosynthesis
MQKQIKQVLGSTKFDLIHIETFYVAQNIPPTSLPVVLIDHNIEHKVYQRFANHAPLAARPFLNIDVAKIKREEETFWHEASQVVAVSEDDQKIMEKSGINAAIVANGVNVEQFAFKEKTNKSRIRKILFIGDFKWIQNQDSAKFILEEIWPLVSAHMECKMWFVARKIPEIIKSLTRDSSVIFDEESSGNPAPHIFQEADVLLAPIRVGGGTSYKILESMSCGTPVVTMPLSANAINAMDGENIMVGRTNWQKKLLRY